MNKDDILRLKKKSSNPSESMFFDGECDFIRSIRGYPYYVRLTKAVVSNSFNFPLLYLYLHCDEAEVYEAKFLIPIEGEENQKILLENTVDCCKKRELKHLINLIKKLAPDWIEAAKNDEFYVCVDNFHRSFKEV